MHMDFKTTSKQVNLPRPYGTHLAVAVKAVAAIATALMAPVMVAVAVVVVAVVVGHVLLVMPWWMALILILKVAVPLAMSNLWKSYDDYTRPIALGSTSLQLHHNALFRMPTLTNKSCKVWMPYLCNSTTTFAALISNSTLTHGMVGLAKQAPKSLLVSLVHPKRLVADTSAWIN